jgi:hypothetical protein
VDRRFSSDEAKFGKYRPEWSSARSSIWVKKLVTFPKYAPEYVRSRMASFPRDLSQKAAGSIPAASTSYRDYCRPHLAHSVP